jgi:hypothetical protein
MSSHAVIRPTKNARKWRRRSVGLLKITIAVLLVSGLLY